MQRDRRAETVAYVMGIECPPLEAFGYSISKLYFRLALIYVLP